MWSLRRYPGIGMLLLSSMIDLSVTPLALAASVDHSLWDQLLKRHASHGLVDYTGLQAERKLLDTYLVRLETVDVDTLPSKDAKLAFWINAYNASVVQGVLEHSPLKSVKDVPGLFNQVRYRVANGSLTLNDIEDRGRKLGDWRIHFAVVCAARGCPVLRNEAYVTDRVEAQLDEQVSDYLGDDVHGMRIDYGSKTLWVSKIFTWYAKDFVSDGPLTAQSLWALIGGFVPQDKPLLPAPEQFRLKFLDYDWSLNARQR